MVILLKIVVFVVVEFGVIMVSLFKFVDELGINMMIVLFVGGVLLLSKVMDMVFNDWVRLIDRGFVNGVFGV